MHYRQIIHRGKMPDATWIVLVFWLINVEVVPLQTDLKVRCCCICCLRLSPAPLTLTFVEKYENVLFVNDTPQSEIKLIDFGLSKKYGKDEELMEGVGTM